MGKGENLHNERKASTSRRLALRTYPALQRKVVWTISFNYPGKATEGSIAGRRPLEEIKHHPFDMFSAIGLYRARALFRIGISPREEGE